MSPVLVEMKTAGACAFVFSQRAQVVFVQLRRLLETMAPHVHFAGWQ